MEPYLGEIRLMGFDYVTNYWMPCQGQLLPINQNQALYSLIGTMYGGDGRTTFALPDLRGRAVLGAGQGPGLQNYPQGQRDGSEQVTLTSQQIERHTHAFTGTILTSDSSDSNSALDFYPAQAPDDDKANFYSAGPANAALNPGALVASLAPTGGSGHENRQPFMAMNYAIAVKGLFPSRG